MTTATAGSAGTAAYVTVPARFDLDSLAPAVSGAVAALHQAAVKDLAKAAYCRPPASSREW